VSLGQAGTDQGCWLCTNSGATACDRCAVCISSLADSQGHVDYRQLVCHASTGCQQGVLVVARISLPCDSRLPGLLIGCSEGHLQAVLQYSDTLALRWRKKLRRRTRSLTDYSDTLIHARSPRHALNIITSSITGSCDGQRDTHTFRPRLSTPTLPRVTTPSVQGKYKPLSSLQCAIECYR
jgi:hypothetical protein